MTSVSDLITSRAATVVKIPQKLKAPGQISGVQKKKSAPGAFAITPLIPVLEDTSRTLAIPEGVATRGVIVVAPPPQSRGKQIQVPEGPVTGSSLWNRHFVQSVLEGEDKRHPG